MLPNVTINITEEVTKDSSVANSFLPLVILKTKTGPIGIETLIKSEKAFINTFGNTDSNTPEAFGLLQYIKYYGSAYVVRVAGSTAATSTAKITVSSTDLIDIVSKYKTDTLNGVEVSLVNDTTNNKLYLSMTVNSTVINSIKETINYSTAKADELEIALGKVVSSFNDAQNYIVCTNLFTGKTASDTKPSSLANAKASLTGGVSGNTGIADSDVESAIEKYRNSDLGIDAILAPGFESLSVISKLNSVAGDSSFIAIASVTGNATTILNAITGFPQSANLALYADKVYLIEDTSIAVPTCLAVLPAYISKNKNSKWLAPAGATRGTLTHVYSLANAFNDSDLESLYINSVPVNGIKKIAGRGFIVWGQKTTSQETTQYLDRINIVRLVKYLVKQVNNISYGYLFEPISDYTYTAWTLQVEAILDDIKVGNGLSDYKVTMDDTLNTEETKKQNKLVGNVKFKPLEAAEFIEINFVVTDSVSEGGNV